ncbi:efflux RND transporter periplasmic adaptor subunit [Rhodoplanes roseus]|uniref:Efflux transporter periplasmic adaptor subunit n=1 Tax=Rhodoplanes roseus TaxID=29409 RepID=A0A327L311_9BRAD|nr:efflux RND transporter periplasmic adaptor subunit [Rhodoplanes roseus]RAI44574.1 efflux transporter periplasmic adaptor subunit [Rhodoplanes roseus]
MSRALGWRAQAVAVLLILGVGAGGATTWISSQHGGKKLITEPAPIAAHDGRHYRPKDSEWNTLSVRPVTSHAFTPEYVTEGKIQVNEDRSTPIFSPYAGRVTRLFAKAGDMIQPGQSLFVVEATDMVQSQNDFIGAVTAMNKAKSALELARITDKRARDLYDAKATPLKDVQQAQAALIAAQNDMRSAETALEAARNRLRILGRSDADIEQFGSTGRINPDTPVFAPIGGTVVQRKIGPGQYVGAGAADPVFVVGDLTAVWLTAYVRESDIGKVRLGQPVSFTVLAYPERVFTGAVDYVGAAVDPTTRRLTVRASIDNGEGLLKPEMFANVTLRSTEDVMAAAVPREALVYEGSRVRAWVARDDRSIELRDLKVGGTDGRMVEVVSGVSSGEQIVTRGSLFIDRLASGN